MEGRLTFLGTGTSMGVPTLGCDCAVCTSADPHDKRLRPSVMVRWNEMAANAAETSKTSTAPESAHDRGRVVVIDTGPDFREQILRSGVKRVDAVLYTHSHADHILAWTICARSVSLPFAKAVPSRSTLLKKRVKRCNASSITLFLPAQPIRIARVCNSFLSPSGLWFMASNSCPFQSCMGNWRLWATASATRLI